MDLTVLFEPKLDLTHVAAVLDELGHSGRLDTIRAWEKKELSALYDAAASFHPIDLNHFVPASVGPMTEVIHHGKNSLTLGSHFQHRVCRPPPPKSGESTELWGYNHQDLALWTGPGYFVVHEAEAPGEVAIDYTQTPTGLAPPSGAPPTEPSGWPKVVPSSARLGRFVFGGTVDIVRGVSRHVAVGRVRRGESSMDVWFALCREDAG